MPTDELIPPETHAGAEPELAERLRVFTHEVALAAEPEGLPRPGDLMAAVVRAVPHTDHASLTVLRSKARPQTIACTDTAPLRADELQYDLGEGPCLDAAGERGSVVRCDDLMTDARWRTFGPRAVQDADVRSVFSTRLPLHSGHGAALTLYAEKAGAFDDLDIEMVALSRSYFSMAVDHHLEQARSANLEIALATSRQIGMAIGILMSSRLLTADQAFQTLVHVSQHTHRKLHDVAADVMETGALPELSPRRRG